MGSQDIHVANTAGFFADLPKGTQQAFRFAISGKGKSAIERFETSDASAECVNVCRCDSLGAFFQRFAELAHAGADFLLADRHGDALRFGRRHR
jgi:hypothetical protein